MKRNFRLSMGEIILLCIAGIFLLSYLYINVFGFNYYATPDVYADTLYAIEAWESKSIFPEGWVFGNQFYVVATPVLCALLYGVIGNVNVAMIVATTMMTVFLIASLIWMLRPVTTRMQQIAAVALMLGSITTCGITLSLEGQLLYVLASYYSCYLITLFITIGDYLRALRQPRRPYYYGMTLLTCFLLISTGMQSIRQTVILILPLCLFEGLRLGAHWWKHRHISGETLRITLRVLVYTVSNVLGLVLIRLLNIENVSIYGEILLRTSDWAQAHEVNMRILSEITGFYHVWNAPNGWLYLIPAVIFCGLTVFAFGRGVYQFIKTGKATPLFVVQVFLVIGLVLLFAINFFVQINFRTPYMFTWYALLAISGTALIEDLKKVPLQILTAVMVIGLICNWMVGCWPIIKAIRGTTMDSEYKMMADYLVAKDIEYIYGDWYSSAPRVALYSNGKIKACCSHGDVFQILPYINPQEYYWQEENKRAAYIFGKDEEEKALAYAAQKGVTMTKMAEYWNYTLYTADQPLMYHLQK